MKGFKTFCFGQRLKAFLNVRAWSWKQWGTGDVFPVTMPLATPSQTIEYADDHKRNSKFLVDRAMHDAQSECAVRCPSAVFRLVDAIPLREPDAQHAVPSRCHSGHSSGSSITMISCSQKLNNHHGCSARMHYKDTSRLDDETYRSLY